MVHCPQRGCLLWSPAAVSKASRCALQAIMESQNNPLAIMNYQDDPDVMLVSGSARPCLPARGCLYSLALREEVRYMAVERLRFSSALFRACRVYVGRIAGRWDANQ